MRVTLDKVSDAYLVVPDVYRDERGFFCCVSDTRSAPSAPFSRFCVARSSRAAVRGLHVRPGAGEAKLVRCSAGSAYDVMVDLRPWSPTYLNWAGITLSGETQLSVYVPAGCAHGYQALADGTDMTYRIDADYFPEAELAIAWNDPELAIVWPLEPGAMSERDRDAPSLAEVLKLL
jgi:dTDP-4-dehydrorhamnose 3,5-epimerase